MSDRLTRPRLIFFTGLGCDARMIASHRAIDADIVFVPWIAPLTADESLANYSARLVANLDRSVPFYLAGISLGGMVAQEVARHVESRGVILIAACRSNRGVPLLHRLVARLVAASPAWLIHVGKTVVPHMRQLFGIVDAREVELFEAMMADADDELIRWSLRATIGWPGAGASDVPTLQIHGERDRVLPLARAGAVDVVIEAAGHAVSVTHSAQVSAAIDAWLGAPSVIQRSAATKDLPTNAHSIAS